MGTRFVAFALVTLLCFSHHTPSFLSGVQNPLKKVFALRFSARRTLADVFPSRIRVHTNFEGSRHWLCRHGFHWILGKAYSHPHVSLYHFYMAVYC
jgi:hypothetical protein